MLGGSKTYRMDLPPTCLRRVVGGRIRCRCRGDGFWTCCCAHWRDRNGHSRHEIQVWPTSLFTLRTCSCNAGWPARNGGLVRFAARVLTRMGRHAGSIAITMMVMRAAVRSVVQVAALTGTEASTLRYIGLPRGCSSTSSLSAFPVPHKSIRVVGASKASLAASAVSERHAAEQAAKGEAGAVGDAAAHASSEAASDLPPSKRAAMPDAESSTAADSHDEEPKHVELPPRDRVRLGVLQLCAVRPGRCTIVVDVEGVLTG